MKTFTLLIAILFAVGLNTSHAQNTWKKKADFGGGARRGAVGFSIGSKGYLGTGINRSNRFTKDFWEYDPASNTWTQKADFGGGLRALAVAFSIGGKGYVGTGIRGRTHKDFWEYDPITNAWTRKADFGGGLREGAVGFSIGSNGYIGTGWFSSSGTKDFWNYDPATDTWIQKADFGGETRAFAAGFSIGSKGYLGTGEGGGYHKDFWEYDPATNAWTQKADFGGGTRDQATGFSISNKGYIGMGTGALSFYKDFWEYDPDTDKWAQKADFGGTGRINATGFSIGSKGYIGMGYYASGNRDFWEYTPENTCRSPSGLKALHVSDTSAILRWDTSGENISLVQSRYRAVGDTAWIARKNDAAKNRQHIYGLMPNTTYQWQARSLCAEDTSGWVKGPDFITDASFAFLSATSAVTGSKLPGNIPVQIMPNPNKGNFTIQLQLPPKAAITTLALYNSGGEKIWQQDAGKISGTVYKSISLQHQLPSGIYMMVIRRNDVSLERKIVISK